MTTHATRVARTEHTQKRYLRKRYTFTRPGDALRQRKRGRRAEWPALLARIEHREHDRARDRARHRQVRDRDQERVAPLWRAVQAPEGRRRVGGGLGVGGLVAGGRCHRSAGGREPRVRAAGAREARETENGEPQHDAHRGSAPSERRASRARTRPPRSRNASESVRARSGGTCTRAACAPSTRAKASGATAGSTTGTP